MANTTSAKQMIRLIAKRTLRNRAIKNNLKTILKKCEKSIATYLKDKTPEKEVILKNDFIFAQKTVFKSVTKGVTHKKKAARIVSNLNKKVKQAVTQ